MRDPSHRNLEAGFRCARGDVQRQGRSIGRERPPHRPVLEYEEEQDRWKNKCDVPQLGSLGILIGLKSRIVGSERAGNPSAPNRSGRTCSVLTPGFPSRAGVAPTAARSFNSEGQL
jgi:hypothetical protein